MTPLVSGPAEPRPPGPSNPSSEGAESLADWAAREAQTLLHTAGDQGGGAELQGLAGVEAAAGEACEPGASASQAADAPAAPPGAAETPSGAPASTAVADGPHGAPPRDPQGLAPADAGMLPDPKQSELNPQGELLRTLKMLPNPVDENGRIASNRQPSMTMRLSAMELRNLLRIRGRSLRSPQHIPKFFEGLQAQYTKLRDMVQVALNSGRVSAERKAALIEELKAIQDGTWPIPGAEQPAQHASPADVAFLQQLSGPADAPAAAAPGGGPSAAPQAAATAAAGDPVAHGEAGGRHAADAAAADTSRVVAEVTSRAMGMADEELKVWSANLARSLKQRSPELYQRTVAWLQQRDAAKKGEALPGLISSAEAAGALEVPAMIAIVQRRVAGMADQAPQLPLGAAQEGVRQQTTGAAEEGGCPARGAEAEASEATPAAAPHEEEEEQNCGAVGAGEEGPHAPAPKRPTDGPGGGQDNFSAEPGTPQEAPGSTSAAGSGLPHALGLGIEAAMQSLRHLGETLPQASTVEAAVAAVEQQQQQQLPAEATRCEGLEHGLPDSVESQQGAEDQAPPSSTGGTGGRQDDGGGRGQSTGGGGEMCAGGAVPQPLQHLGAAPAGPPPATNGAGGSGRLPEVTAGAKRPREEAPPGPHIPPTWETVAARGILAGGEALDDPPPKHPRPLQQAAAEPPQQPLSGSTLDRNGEAGAAPIQGTEQHPPEKDAASAGPQSDIRRAPELEEGEQSGGAMTEAAADAPAASAGEFTEGPGGVALPPQQQNGDEDTESDSEDEFEIVPALRYRELTDGHSTGGGGNNCNEEPVKDEAMNGFGITVRINSTVVLDSDSDSEIEID